MELWAWKLCRTCSTCTPTATRCKPDNRVNGQTDVVTARCQPDVVTARHQPKLFVKAGSQNTSCSQDMKHLVRWGSVFSNDISTGLLVSAPFIKCTGLVQRWERTSLRGWCLTKVTDRVPSLLKTEIVMVLIKANSQKQPMNYVRGANRRMTIITLHRWLHLSQ